MMEIELNEHDKKALRQMKKDEVFEYAFQKGKKYYKKQYVNEERRRLMNELQYAKRDIRNLKSKIMNMEKVMKKAQDVVMQFKEFEYYTKNSESYTKK